MVQNGKPGGNITTWCLMIGIRVLLSHECIEVLAPMIMECVTVSWCDSWGTRGLADHITSIQVSEREGGGSTGRVERDRKRENEGVRERERERGGDTQRERWRERGRGGIEGKRVPSRKKEVR